MGQCFSRLLSGGKEENFQHDCFLLRTTMPSVASSSSSNGRNKRRRRKKNSSLKTLSLILVMASGGEGDEEGSADRHCIVQFSPTVHSTTSKRFFTLFLPGEEREKVVS